MQRKEEGVGVTDGVGSEERVTELVGVLEGVGLRVTEAAAVAEALGVREVEAVWEAEAVSVPLDEGVCVRLALGVPVCEALEEGVPVTEAEGVEVPVLLGVCEGVRLGVGDQVGVMLGGSMHQAMLSTSRTEEKELSCALVMLNCSRTAPGCVTSTLKSSQVVSAT